MDGVQAPSLTNDSTERFPYSQEGTPLLRGEVSASMRITLTR
jgi:hypothetical protein